MHSTHRRSRLCHLLQTRLLALAGLLMTSVLVAQPATDLQLPAPAQGTAAIAALGAHLPDVAKAYGLRAQELASLLQVQPSLGVDVRGALRFACRSVAANGANLTGLNEPQNGLTATSSVSVIASGGTVDAFQLHSLPGATRVLYLDFDGHITKGTAWNSGGDQIVSPPFDMDGDPSTFNATERAAIQSIWRRVAEDYAPFAINVTTQDPGVEALRKSTSSDTAYGTRVIITPSNWYDPSAGGVAYVGSFSSSTDTGCFVFTGQLANHEKYIAEVVSHEAGHTVGLFHDGAGGAAPTEYYYGQGNWAPIMGAGFYGSVTQFSRGEYANANNTQDDLAVIATYAPLAADDHGGTVGAASSLAGPNVAGGGTIETRADVDVFRFATEAGSISLRVVSPANESNLHMQVELLNSSGQVLLANAPSELSATFTPTLSAGTYYVRISGVGYGDPKSTGYSDYASVGNYVITGTLVPIAGQQPPIAQATSSTTSGLAALKVDFNGQGSVDPDGVIAGYRWEFGNGDVSTAANPSYTFNVAGGYTAILTVTDNVGLSSSASIFINVTAAANQAPTAVAAASVVSGVTPLPIVFSSAGSTDSDGTIVSYQWSFGDGSSSTQASPSKTYSTPGNYTVTLTVTDNLGATAMASVAVSVAGDPNRDFDVAQYTLAAVTSRSGVNGSATVIVQDRLGRAVAGASVTIQWSGVVTGTTTVKTDTSGNATLASNRSKKAGTITGKISAVTSTGGAVFDDKVFSSPLSLTVSTK